jgi:hypothetical protein
MPVPGIQNPSSAYTGPYATGRNPILQGYVFNAQLEKPEVSSFITEKFKDRYKMTTLLNRLGAYKPVANGVYSWFIQDRQRLSATLGTVAGLPATTFTTTLTDIPADASGNLGYFIVNDLVRTESGAILRVSAVSNSGGVQQVTFVKVGGGSIAAADAATGEKIGHISNAFEEGSTGPNGRLFLPSESYNYTQTFRRGCKVTGSALTEKTWINDESWYWKNEDYTFDEFAYDQELSLMFGVRAADTATGLRTSQGIWDKVVTAGGGQNVSFSSGVGIAESDLQQLITRLNRQAGSSNLLMLCGSEAVTDIQIALKNYFLAGAVDYGAFGGNTVGLDASTYKFGGKTLTLMHYPLFDDDRALPFVATPTTSKVNFRHVALALDLGDTENGEPLIQTMYRELGGEQRKFIHKVIPGMHGGASADNGGIASNSFDGFEVQIEAEIGWKMLLENQSGALIPNA